MTMATKRMPTGIPGLDEVLHGLLPQKADSVPWLRAGYQMYVAKPVEPAELIAIVDSLAKRGEKA